MMNIKAVFRGELEEKKVRKIINKSIIKAGFCMSLFNLAVMLPVILLALVTNDMLESYFIGSLSSINLWGYWLMSAVLMVIIYVTYRIGYHFKYMSSGKEDMRLRMELADKIRKLPLSYLGKRNLSDLTSVIMDDVAVATNIMSKVVTELIGGLVSGIVMILCLLFVDWKLSLCLGAFIPIVIIVMSLSRRISEGTNKKNRKKKLDISDGIQEYLENMKVLKSTRQMTGYQQRLRHKIKRVIPGLVLYELLAGLTISISYNVMRIGLGITIIAGSALLIKREVNLVIFFLFLYVAVRIYEPLTSACELLGELIHSFVSAKRIQDVLEYPEQTGETDIELKNFDITFDNVSFGYNEEQVIKNVSFTAKQGEITALVGPSGCGKSTLCKLAARFWDVEQGTVTIGEHNVNEITPEELLKNYSFVFQDVVLFNDTIYNNIKIGRENATREEVLTAARMARCEEFIERMPQGYDTVIGENGQTLSGGERQRLSIARAFLKDAPIILLDESTASIDPENETKIQEAIGKLIENKTVLIIAHKLRSIVDCDKIVVLKEGKLDSVGTHEQLMSEEGMYHKLYTLQNESMKWTVSSK